MYCNARVCVHILVSGTEVINSFNTMTQNALLYQKYSIPICRYYVHEYIVLGLLPLWADQTQLCVNKTCWYFQIDVWVSVLPL